MSGRADGADELGGSAPDHVTPPAEEKPVDDPTSATLAREVYWAGEGASRRSVDIGSLRERLDAFTHQMRLEQRQPVPTGGVFLESTSGWRRRTKHVVWRLTRFSTMRHDRLLADLAEMNGDLARRLLEIEEEVARLREELDRRGGDAS